MPWLYSDLAITTCVFNQRFEMPREADKYKLPASGGASQVSLSIARVPAIVA